jgi:lipopolysaccharide/colanic/teichoic acid biosynthesis glycosyltransferase
MIIQSTARPGMTAGVATDVPAAIRVEAQPATIHNALTFNPRYLRWKRVCDLALTLIALVPFGLILAVTALAIRLDSPGPIFYRQKRIGADGVEFEMLKFRSMHHNSDQSVHQRAAERWLKGQALNEDPTMSFKLARDPRITRVGRFIRKTSIDELPQVWNVLRGEMALVGPRPPVPYEVQFYGPRDRLRLCGKPGLTGPWQVDGRGRVPFREMVEQDIAYLHRQSLLYDLKLILLTVPVMVFARGGA